MNVVEKLKSISIYQKDDCLEYLKNSDIPLVLLGTTLFGEMVKRFFDRNEIKINIVAVDKEYWLPSTIFFGFEVYSLEDVLANNKEINIVVAFISDNIEEKIEQLEKVSNIKKCIFLDPFELAYSQERNISYYDLQNMELILWGEEKICLDTVDFFSDLNIIDSQPFDSEIYVQSNQTVVICSFFPYPYIEKLQMKKINFITIDDMILTVDEVELYNNAVNHREKKIIVLGDKQDTSFLICQNPNLRIDYILNSEEYYDIKKEHSGYVRIICAMEPNNDIRNLLNGFGFIFGKDFYFYYSMRLFLPSPSLLLRKTIQDKPKINISCSDKPIIAVSCDGTKLCLRAMPQTNTESLAYTDLENIVYSLYFRISHLSMSNKTFSFCNTDVCPMQLHKNSSLEKYKEIQRDKYLLKKPQEYSWRLNYDNSCNMKCITCRDCYKVSPDGASKEIIDMIHQTVIENISLMQDWLFTAGEAFYGKYNKDIIFDKNPHKEIRILTNGILFDEKNWEKIRRKYDRIKRVSVSVDAASKETYEYIRGGNFDLLIKNLYMLSKLRKADEIESFDINFVISVFNFHEMKKFVKFARELSCDYCLFTKFHYRLPWHCQNYDVYDNENQHHKEFLKIISDPIFRSPDVHILHTMGLEHFFN